MALYAPQFFFVVHFYFIYGRFNRYVSSSQEIVGVFSRESRLLLGLSLSVATQSVRQYKTILVPITVLSRRREKILFSKIDTFFEF